MLLTICGTGLAGLRVCSELRALGWNDHIRVIDHDPHPPYDRPPLSKDLFGSYIRPLSADGFGEISSLASSIHTTHITGYDGTTVLSDEGRFESDITVITTGQPARSTIDGAYVLRTRDDAHQLRHILTDSVTILGGGWIGCELAATCARHGLNVHLLEQDENIVASLGPVSSHIRAYLESQDVRISTGTSDLPSNDAPVVEATGTDRSVVVNADPWGRLAPGLYGLGDAVWWEGAPPPGHWKLALDQAPILAQVIMADLAGEQIARPHFTPEIFSTIGDLEILVIGELTGIPVLVGDSTSLRCVWVEDQVLTGGVVINRPTDGVALRKNVGHQFTVEQAAHDLPLKKLLRQCAK